MTYDYSLDIVSMLIMILIYAVLRGKQKANILMYKVYNWLLIITFSSSALNVIMTELLFNTDVFGTVLPSVVGSLYSVLLTLLTALYTIYILCMAGIDYNVDNMWKGLILIPFAITVAGTIYIIFTQQTVGYSYWNAKMLVVLIYSLYYILLWTIVLAKYRKMLNSTKRTYIGVFIIVHLFVLVLFLITEKFELFTFEVSMLLLVNLYAIQSPEEYFDKSDAMLYKHFIDNVKLDITRDKDYSVLFIRFHDIDVKYDSFGDINTNKLLSRVVAFIQESHQSAIVYRVDKKTFAVKLASMDEAEKKELILRITKRLREEFRYGDLSAIFAVSTVLFNSSTDITKKDNFEEIVSFIKNTDVKIGEDITYKELLKNDKETEIIECIKKAVENNGFMVYYQPIYSTNKKKIVAAEALIRLFDEKLGFISPEIFIPLAEREGYILSIGEFVFTEVCRFYSENKLNNKGIDYIEVNLSAVQCMQYKLADEFIEIMHKYGLNSSQINFEITETSAMNKNGTVELNINYFVDHGVDLSLDDYGTGYSNISYLYNLPFAFMKIDKSILWSSDKNDKANITLKNIFKMAKNLKMRTVVEGVETEEHIKKLLKLECDYFQGYYFSKPVNGNDFMKYLDEFTVPGVCLA